MTTVTWPAVFIGWCVLRNVLLWHTVVQVEACGWHAHSNMHVVCVQHYHVRSCLHARLFTDANAIYVCIRWCACGACDASGCAFAYGLCACTHMQQRMQQREACTEPLTRHAIAVFAHTSFERTLDGHSTELGGRHVRQTCDIHRVRAGGAGGAGGARKSVARMALSTKVRCSELHARSATQWQHIVDALLVWSAH
jgi:hypothetical protein